MKRLLALTATPTLLLLGACGPGNDIVTTNDNNVVLNDMQANYASTNDDEYPAPGATADPDNAAGPTNDMAPGAMANGANTTAP